MFLRVHLATLWLGGSPVEFGAKQVGSGDVAKGRTVIGSWVFLPWPKPQKQQHFLVCLERQRRRFSCGKNYTRQTLVEE